jgi:DNA modification methylase
MRASLLLGDCVAVMRTLLSKSFRLIYVDPPYAQSSSLTAWNKSLDWHAVWPEMLRLLTADGVIVIHAIEPLTARLIVAQEQLFRHKYTWKRPNNANFLYIQTAPLRFCEDIIVFSRRNDLTFNPQCAPLDTPVYRPRAEKRLFQGRIMNRNLRPYTVDKRPPRDLLEFGFDPVMDRRLMRTQKPVALGEYIIRTYSNPGDHVLDFCCGSGTSGVAAIRLDQCYTGIENNVEHFAIARQRLEGWKCGK